MKTRSTLIALTGLALTGTALGQAFNYNDRDLTLVFRKSGFSDVEINLNSVKLLTVLAPGTTQNFSQAGLNYYNATTQVLNQFGGSLNGVSVSVFGTQSAVAGNATDTVRNTSWLSYKQVDPATLVSVPAAFFPAKAQNVQSAISGINGQGVNFGTVPFGAIVDNQVFPNTENVVVIPSTSAHSFTIKNPTVGSSGLLKQLGGAFPLENTFTSDSSLRSELFEMAPNGTPGYGNEGKYVGYLDFEANGQVIYTAVPEPQEYAALTTGLLLAGAVLRRGFVRA